MKKYFGILTAFLVIIGVMSFSSTANAMTQQDLGGKAYFSNNPDRNNGRTKLIMFNKDATRYYELVMHKELDGSYKPMTNKKEYYKVISSEKEFNKYSYKVKDKEQGNSYLLNKKGTKMYLSGYDWGGVKGDAVNGFSASYDGGSYVEKFIPAPINVNFTW